LTVTAVTLSSCCRLNVVTATPLMMRWWWNLLLLRRSWRCTPALRVVLSSIPGISTRLWTGAPILILLHHISRWSHRTTHHRSPHLSIGTTHRSHIPGHSHWRSAWLRWTPLSLMTIVHFASRITCTPIKLMWSILKNQRDISRITKCYKSKTPATTGFTVFHNNAVNYFAITAKVALKIFLCCLPGQTTNKQLSVTTKSKQ
ncbi:hypothetical protein WN55_01841, partial [Dufourea novaeangliae]